MTALSEYFAAKHQALENGYTENCLTIAREIARLLLDQKKQPYMMTLNRFEDRGDVKYYGPLMPVRYRGAVTFTRHYVCCCDGQAYDPIHSVPVSISDYSTTIFGIEIFMHSFISGSEMIDYLARFERRAKDTDATDQGDIRGSDPSSSVASV